MGSSVPPNYTVRAEFDDFDAFTEAARGWDLRFRQLDSGSFSSSLVQHVSPTMQLGYARLGRCMDQEGKAPTELRTLVLARDPSERYRWRSQDMTGDYLGLFPANGEIAGRTPPGWEIYTISLVGSRLRAAIESVGGDPETLALEERWHVPAPRLAQLRRYLGRMFAARAVADSGGVLPEEDVVLLVSEAITAGQPEQRRPRPWVRTRALVAAMEVIRAHEHESLALADLARASGASIRTLGYAFHDRYGVSPKRYLLLRRLNGVHRDLAAAEKGSTTVTAVAGRWGFWHMGELAAAYRRLFGELPSSTLAR